MHQTHLFMMLVFVAVTSLTFCQGSPVSQQGNSFKATSTVNSNNAQKDVEFLSQNEKLLDLFNKYPSYNYPNYRPLMGYPNYYPYQGNMNPIGGYGGIGGGYPGINPTGMYPGFAGTGQYPGTTGTNFLGAGGFGGYGGANGNGGLPSYSGYNNNNYYGNRNMGFGYYQGTNSYGLGVPTLASSGGTVTPQNNPTGFRGYN